MRTFKILAPIITLSLGGCAASFQVQAPFDGFVCSQSSYQQCLAGAQSSTLSRFSSANYSGKIGLRRQSVVPNDGDDQIVITADKKYSCKYSHAAYVSSLNQEAVAPLVFVSPLLISQIEEQKVRIGRAREACRRVAESYDYQERIIGLQDGLTIAQRGSSRLEAEIEGERLKHDAFGGRILTDDEAAKTGVAKGTNVQAAVQQLKIKSADVADQIREQSKAQTIDVDYGRMFDDAQLLIDTQLRELSRDYFILDRAVYQSSDAVRLKHYLSGSWVAKGTVVAKAGHAS